MPEEKSITREDLEYVFNAAAEKFMKVFQAARIEPEISITHNGTTSVDDINKALTNMVLEKAKVAAGGSYQAGQNTTQPKNITDYKVNLLGHEIKRISSVLFDGCRAKIEFWYGGEKDCGGSFTADVPIDWITFESKD